MIAKNWAIKAEGLSKKFGLSLRQSMKYGLQDSLKRLVGVQTNSAILRHGEFWAVKDVTFELNYGEALGIMGVNGCGKTTLLRILNGVYSPDKGKAMLRGRVGAMIAAGAGFAPMLSGRENIYVNGALLGLSTSEIDGLMEEIVHFSELENFIDLPVRNYSSGMYVRLGFAIAAMSKPDVLLMDEVLAVGDLNFQKKCFDYILKLKEQGTAIVLVSHSPGAIWSVCDRGLFIDKGQLLVNGSVEDAIRAYDDQNSRNAISSSLVKSTEETQKNSTPNKKTIGEQSGTGDVISDEFFIISSKTLTPSSELEFGEPFHIHITFTAQKPIDDLVIRVVVDATHYRNILTIDSYEQGMRLEKVDEGTYRCSITVPSQNLRPGAYTFNMAILSKHIGLHLFLWLKCYQVVIRSPLSRFFYSDPMAVFHVDADFSVEQI